MSEKWNIIEDNNNNDEFDIKEDYELQIREFSVKLCGSFENGKRRQLVSKILGGFSTNEKLIINVERVKGATISEMCVPADKRVKRGRTIGADINRNWFVYRNYLEKYDTISCVQGWCQCYACKMPLCKETNCNPSIGKKSYFLMSTCRPMKSICNVMATMLWNISF